MTVSTHRVVPEAHASGTAPCAEMTHHLPAPNRAQLNLFASSEDPARQALARAARDDFPEWLQHVRAAAECTRPIRLSGSVMTVESVTGRVLSTWDTSDKPDGVIYKRCGNRRGGVCPSCSRLYQRDAYQVVRSGLVGGKGVPETVAEHPCIFSTFTAPSFGPVHHRLVKRHTCENRASCDCRAEPCHPRRDNPACEHGRPATCFARHERDDRRLGTPICPDCYDYEGHVVWNLFSGELWRRTKITLDRELAKLCKAKGIPPHVIVASGRAVKKARAHTSCGKVAEFQARAAVHFHALIRLDGLDPDDAAAVVAPPASLTIGDLVRTIQRAASSVSFTTPPHPDRPQGWRIQWGAEQDNRPVTLTAHGEVTDAMAAVYVNQVAGYLAKYATKSTEATGHTSTRINESNVDQYADASGSHTQRLIATCWRLGRPLGQELREMQQSQIRQTLQAVDRLLIGHSDDASLLDLRKQTAVDLAQLETSATLGKRPQARPPAVGAVRPWTCEACGARCSTVHCQRCQAPQYEKAQRLQRLLFLLLLAEAIEPPEEEANPYAGLRRWAHMLGFGGHFLTKSRRYSIAFRILREARVTFRRNEPIPPAGDNADGDQAGEQTTVLLNTLTFVGVGWHTSADAMLAQTASALAREHQQLARHLILAQPI